MITPLPALVVPSYSYIYTCTNSSEKLKEAMKWKFLAAQEGLKWSAVIEFSRLLLETDCLIVANVL